MLKVSEVFASGPGHAEKEAQMQGSGGGGPVEAVWWIKETMTQWRMKGEAFVVGEDIEGQGEQTKESSGVRTVKSELGRRMRIVDEGKQGDWSWANEVTGHFGNLSPSMRGMCASCLNVMVCLHLTDSLLQAPSRHLRQVLPRISLMMTRTSSPAPRLIILTTSSAARTLGSW